jgi:hydroxysqualene dehydroxylase
VAVVGGGLAGLAAALECADAGAEVTLFENRPRLGGATWSFRRHGAWFDNGQHVFLRCCTEYRRFLDRLGVSSHVHLQSRLDVPVISPAGRTARLRRSRRLPAPLHLGAALARYRHLSLPDRARLLPAALALRAVDPDAPASDAVTFGQWLAARGQSPAAVERLWDLIILPTVNLPAAEASLAMAAKVFRTGLLEESGAADIGWSRLPLGRLHGEAGRRALEAAGGRVRLGTAVAAIEPGPSGVRVVTADGNGAEYDGAVVAVPHDRIGPLLPPGTVPAQARLTQLGTSPIVNVHIVYDRRVTDHALMAAVDSPVQWVFDHTEPAGLGQGQALTVSLSAADAHLGRPAAALAASIVAELARLLPGTASARVEHTVVTRERAATFRAVPGTAALRPPAVTAHPRVCVAGAWTDTGWPATMEGAVRSGSAAARRLLVSVRPDSRLPEEVPA